MSNELNTPKVHICPADARRRSAEHWEKLSVTSWGLLQMNDIIYEWLAQGEPDTNSNRIVLRCPIHAFAALAGGGVLDGNERAAPNGKPF